MSPNIERLEREIHATADPVARAELYAQLAGYLVRTGFFEESRRILGDLRADFSHGRNPRVSVWIMFVEGLLHYYAEFSPKAMERMRGAQAIALASNCAPIAALASAWKAQFEFEASKFDAMTESLKIALSHAEENDHDALSRIGIILCNAFEYCSNKVQVQHWFRRTHAHAVASGDQASIEALQHNRAVIRISALFVGQCFNELDSESLRFMKTEISSAMGLQALIGINALTNQILLAQAQLQIIEGKFTQAIDTLLRVPDLRPYASHNYCRELIDLEIGYSLFRSGQMDAALHRCTGLDTSAFDRLDTDDRLVAAWMRRCMCRADARQGDARTAQSEFLAARRRYVEQRRHLANLLSAFELA
ncbi:MAG: hypothetical protein KGL18_09180 [Burkholderiales bacterium]|nr:hypothetical protein [Burkholderiales bacterium]MDE1926964.1 hypothetical protein [Burkholderiales bacterium]MDE2503132.1 hypothetical protein [Burkholderiales bacterium]